MIGIADIPDEKESFPLYLKRRFRVSPIRAEIARWVKLFRRKTFDIREILI
jgi:hypothetical protein